MTADSDAAAASVLLDEMDRAIIPMRERNGGI